MAEAGRSGNIDSLPDRGLPALRWAYARIREERMTQIAMRTELNAKLAEAGLPPVSASSFNRYVGRVRDGQVREPPMPTLPEGAIGAALGTELDGLRSALLQTLEAVEKLQAAQRN